jgi:hypothetical protein
MFLPLTYVPGLAGSPGLLFGIACGIMTVIQLSIMIPLACTGYFDGLFVTEIWFCTLNFLAVTMIDHYCVNTFGFDFIVSALRYYIDVVLGLIIAAIAWVILYYFGDLIEVIVDEWE